MYVTVPLKVARHLSKTGIDLLAKTSGAATLPFVAVQQDLGPPSEAVQKAKDLRIEEFQSEATKKLVLSLFVNEQHRFNNTLFYDRQETPMIPVALDSQ